MLQAWSDLSSLLKKSALTEWCSLAVAGALFGASFWIFDLPGAMGWFKPRAWAPATVSTVALIAGLALLCVIWPTSVGQTSARRRWGYAAGAAIIVATVWALERTISAWMSQLVLIAIDAYRADMLVQIQAAAERFSTGRDRR
jgi:hypothetical protein